MNDIAVNSCIDDIPQIFFYAKKVLNLIIFSVKSLFSLCIDSILRYIQINWIEWKFYNFNFVFNKSFFFSISMHSFAFESKRKRVSNLVNIEFFVVVYHWIIIFFFYWTQVMSLRLDLKGRVLNVATNHVSKVVIH